MRKKKSEPRSTARRATAWLPAAGIHAQDNNRPFASFPKREQHLQTTDELLQQAQSMADEYLRARRKQIALDMLSTVPLPVDTTHVHHAERVSSKHAMRASCIAGPPKQVLSAREPLPKSAPAMEGGSFRFNRARRWTDGAGNRAFLQSRAQSPPISPLHDEQPGRRNTYSSRSQTPKRKHGKLHQVQVSSACVTPSIVNLLRPAQERAAELERHRAEVSKERIQQCNRIVACSNSQPSRRDTLSLAKASCRNGDYLGAAYAALQRLYLNPTDPELVALFRESVAGVHRIRHVDAAWIQEDQTD